jgi:hypothetical protein
MNLMGHKFLQYDPEDFGQMEVKLNVQGPMKNLARKLAAVTLELTHVAKNGKNKAQGYEYVTEADVAEAVRGPMARQGLVLIPSVKSVTFRSQENKSGGTTHIATVLVGYTLIDAESGESTCFDAVGEGMDSGDKQVFKAVTGANKYALLKLFQLPTGDDPENDSDEKPVAAPAPVVKKFEKPEPVKVAPKAGTYATMIEFVNNSDSEAKLKTLLPKITAELTPEEQISLRPLYQQKLQSLKGK